MEKTPTFPIEKNWNGKMQCGVFVHVTRQPKDGLRLPMKIMVTTKDGSCEPRECELYDLGRSSLSECPDHLIALSHGMTKDEYYALVTEGVTDPLLPNELMVGVYLFRGVENGELGTILES